MTIKNNQVNSNFHQIAITDVDGKVTGIQTEGIVLADAANLTIGGGALGQVLKTDGTGNLSWGDAAAGTGNITFDGNKIIGDGSMSLVPDITQEGNDRYLIVEQTNEGLTLRPGGSVDNSAANINIGSPKNRFVASDDDGSARMENNQLTTVNNFYLDSSTFSTAQWINGGIAFNDASQTVLDAIWALTTESLIEITDGNQWWTVTYAGSSTPGVGQTNTLFVNENPPVDPTEIQEVDIAIRTLVSAFVEVSSRDVTITAADDLRLTATDVFSLRNTSSTDPITITTDGNSSSHTWNFGQDAILTLPSNGDIVDSNGISIIGRDVNYATTAGVANSVDGVNVSGEVANAAYATTAGVANSVDAANVVGEIANATFATTAGSATVASSANAVDGANVSGEVANAAFATSAGSATVADSANSVALANVAGAGNIAAINLNGNTSTYLSGNGAWATITSGGYKYTREIHVDPVNGNDTTGTGAYDKPYLTIMKAHSVITSGQAVYLHVGAYTENVTWTKTNTDIIGLSQGGQVNTSGTWIVGCTVGASVRLTDIAFNGTFTQNSTGRVFFRRCQVNGAFTKTSGEYLQAIDTDFGTSVAINSAGTVVIQGAQTNGLTVNNASAVVSVADLISGAVFTNTAGTLLISNSIIYSATPTTAAVTSAAGTATYMYNSSTATSSGTQARVSFAGFWTVDSTRFDRANSTLTGTNLGTISHSDALYVFGVTTLGAVGNVKITGGSNGQVLTTNGSGNLSWTTVSSGGNVAYANVAGVANSVAGANVSGAVANATFATTAGTAQSVTLANVSGAGNIASVNLNGNGSTVLAGNGAWVSTGGGEVAYADAAGVAYSVAGANVSGTVGAASIAYSVNAANVVGQVSSAASADVALSVAGANVTGEVAFAATANSISGANVSGQVANAASADVALSVARSNVGGVTGIGGQVQWSGTNGNLTSSERHWIGGNGTTAFNVSRDGGAGTILSGYSYYNATGAGTMFFSRARGTKAAPLPVQVGDRIFSTVGQVYTGTGSATADGIAGWTPTTIAAAISADITALPTSNTTAYGSKLTFAASNATSNSVFVMTFNDNGMLDAPKLRVNSPSAPASATSTGSRGEIAFDNDYVYVCVGTDTWKRSPLTTW